MTDYVLVHGAFGSGRNWRKIARLLEAKGHLVHALDLPGPENDGTPVMQVTLDLYAASVVSLIESLDRKVILAGHSMGGLVISAVAERIPEKIMGLVYVTALLVRNGQAGFEIPLGSSSSAPSGFDPASGYITMPGEAAAALFYNCCSEDDRAEALAVLREKQALAPLLTPLQLTQEKFGRVPRHYVECLQDKAIHLDIQRAMRTAWPCESVATLDVDHAPYRCRPVELANYLNGLGG